MGGKRRQDMKTGRNEDEMKTRGREDEKTRWEDKRIRGQEGSRKTDCVYIYLVI